MGYQRCGLPASFRQKNLSDAFHIVKNRIQGFELDARPARLIP
jgi:hypothetical protein